MSYDAKEKSQYGGSPVELYKFQIGSTLSYFTSADKDQTYASNTYLHDVITRSEIDASDEDQQGMLEVTVPRTNAIADVFVPNMPIYPVQLTIYRFHRGDAEVLQLWMGEVSGVSFSGSTVKLSCQPVGNVLRRQIPSTTYGAQCNWSLYSSQCGITASAYSDTGNVATVAGAVLTVTMGDHPSGYFNNGFVLSAWGERTWILSHTRLSSSSAQLTLMVPFSAIYAGAAVTVYAGCDRTTTDCKNKFNNLVKFLGFPYLPTKNPFVTGVK